MNVRVFSSKRAGYGVPQSCILIVVVGSEVAVQ